MSYTTNYTSLIAEIQATVEDTAAEFQANLQTIVNRGEARLIKDLDLEVFSSTFTGNLTASNRVLAWPAGLVDPTDVWITVSGSDVLVLPMTEGFCRMYAPDATDEGQPVYYAMTDNTQFYFVPTPSSAYAYTIRGTKWPTKLSAGNTTNILTDKFGQSLFYSCLIETEAWLIADDRIPVWAAMYQKSVAADVDNFRGQRRDDYHPLRIAAKVERRA